MTSHKEITRRLRTHYRQTFAEHGATSRGVDWGEDPADHDLRLDRMLAVLERGVPAARPATLLDVGCGYGSIANAAQSGGHQLEITGIDVCAEMIAEARDRHPDATWEVADILESSGTLQFDYVVCSGILTQKLDASQKEMDAFLKAIVRRMFDLSRIGIAFNVMTTHVNFMNENLYYRNPAELLAWCMSEITPCVRLDHSYPLFEYSLYLYRDQAPGLAYGAHRSSTEETS